MYSHRATHGPVDLAFTDRHGGVSVVPWDSLNLALEGQQDPDATAANVRRVVDDFAPDAVLAPGGLPPVSALGESGAALGPWHPRLLVVHTVGSRISAE